MILTIAGRELRALFLSPLAWTVLAVITFLMAWLFFAQLDVFLQLIQPRLAANASQGITDIIVAPHLSTAVIILMLVVPLMSMRLVAEEKRNATLPLLLSAPVSITQIVLGKYFGLLAFLWLALGLIVAMPLSLEFGTSLDLGKLAAGTLGLALLLAAFAAAGLFMSTLTRQPAVAAISTFGLLLLLWLIDIAAGAQNVTGGVAEYLSLLKHYQSLLRGLFNSADVIYYLLVIAAFLIFSIRKLDAERLQR